MDQLSSPSSQVLKIAERVFSLANRSHGLKHACKVEQSALEIAQEPEFAGIPLDITVLSAAALLHDSGHTKVLPSWSSDRIEHIEESVRIAQEALTAVAPFDTNPDKIRQVCYLILCHDETNYSFPIKTRDGKPGTTVSFGRRSEWPYFLPHEEQSVHAMLTILKEADASMATGAEGAERTLKYSLARGIPLLVEGNPLNAWMWEESAVGNIRLAAKRALLDAFTARGKDAAWLGYLEAEQVIRSLAKENDVTYQDEVHLAELRGIIHHTVDGDFYINRFHSWEKLVEALRKKVGLLGDVSIHPYQDATIESKVVEVVRLSPLARYIMKSQLEAGRQLCKQFLNSYGFAPFDLSGMVDFAKKDQEIRLSPPIVEVYTERKGPFAGKEIWALVDGLHRFWNAIRDGYSRIRAVVISNVPEHLPLVPLPLRWEDVRIVDNIPDESKKREFRFPDCESFPDISWFSSVPSPSATRNCRYFFYRDLSPLGSSGIRKVVNNEESIS